MDSWLTSFSLCSLPEETPNISFRKESELGHFISFYVLKILAAWKGTDEKWTLSRVSNLGIRLDTTSFPCSTLTFQLFLVLSQQLPKARLWEDAMSQKGRWHKLMQELQASCSCVEQGAALQGSPESPGYFAPGNSQEGLGHLSTWVENWDVDFH